MTEKYTPEKVAELVAEARKLLFSDSAFGYEDTKEGDLILRLADALTAVSASRDRYRGLLRRTELQCQDAEAECDRLHRAVTEALDHDPLHGRSEGLHCGGMSPCIRGILCAALDVWDAYGDDTLVDVFMVSNAEGGGSSHRDLPIARRFADMLVHRLLYTSEIILDWAGEQNSEGNET